MTPTLWIGIIGTIVALAFAANGLRAVRAGPGHAANAGRLHMMMVIVFLPLLWLTIALIQL
ncbi:hypothetical protein FGU71_04235 [Erythrobacter insulae]|uniref:Uncharacterized protein n=1 Tax=Erythrobacter insulae TaxID=2584124 RepID=A0A547PAL9_9SPHN|nr:hypothetical protein [Erythrobacter insulae]TRD11137.1 hypothetical protein FGU71_04235 [Erythrobacter insulae]